MTISVRKIRGVIVFLLALLFGVIAARWVFWAISKPRVSEVKLVAAAGDIEKGEKLVKDKLMMVEWPKDKVPPGSFTREEAVIGKKANSMICQGELINNKKIKSRKAEGFSGSIEPEMRAISIKVDEVSGVSLRKLKEGDRVDIIATSNLTEAGKVSRIILNNVMVMGVAIDKDKKEKKTHLQKRWTVTLMVRDVDVALLSAACEGSKIKLALRNPNETNKTKLGEAVFTPQGGILNNFVLPEIRKGKRAITIEVKDTDGICGYLRPGDRVDLIVTCPVSKFASSGNVSPGARGKVTELRMVSRIFLQNVEILSTERVFQKGSEIKGPVKKVALLVSPQEVEKISVLTDATSKSIIRLVRRSSDDNQIVKTRGEKLADLLTQKRELSQVELIRGTEWKLRTFYK